VSYPVLPYTALCFSPHVSGLSGVSGAATSALQSAAVVFHAQSLAFYAMHSTSTSEFRRTGT